jgi:hypothetical protein
MLKKALKVTHTNFIMFSDMSMYENLIEAFYGVKYRGVCAANY